jgi:homoserine dehydrogenase
MKPIQVGLLGIGVVGLGTFNVLRRNQEEIKRRAGRGIEITMVADLDVARAQSLVGPEVKVVNDARAVIANPDIDIVIERSDCSGQACGHGQQGAAGCAWHRDLCCRIPPRRDGRV